MRGARQMIRECLDAHGRADLADTAELLVSEIVTNALVHAGTSIEVAFSLVDGGLRVEVTDGSPHAPAPRGYGPNAGTGRGLMLLEELVADWGVVPAGPGKTVWFLIRADHGVGTGPRDASARPDPAEAPTAGDGGRQTPSGGTVDVQLVDVPLLLHEAWRQHAESLLREYLLASLDLENGDDPIEVHAQASDAIALLAEQIPASGVGQDPTQVMVNAVEPWVTGRRVTLSVPRDSVPHFATLSDTLESALALVDAGGFLNPTTQPEVQSLRVWICGEVRRQSAGEAPVPWSPLHDLPLMQPHLLRWDTERVSGAARAVIAADDTDRIVAVSAAALELLGYSHEVDLLGSRLICVIPERYRQAHLAGFTMHFLSGRAPLIGATVVVPTMRADGSEILVSLTVGTERTDDGRTVFVADLAPAPAA